MRRFGGETVKNLMDRMGMEEDIPIEHNLVSKSIENSQVRVEGFNFDLRKHLLEYDDVINKQREVIYAQRKQVLSEEDLRSRILPMVEDELESLVDSHTLGEPEEWDLKGLAGTVRTILPPDTSLSPKSWEGKTAEEITDELSELAEKAYDEKEKRLGPVMRQLERLILLGVVDSHWMRHLTALDELRTGVGLRAYGQRDPLVEFKTEAFSMFQNLTAAIQGQVAKMIFHAEVMPQPVRGSMREVRPGVTAGAVGGTKPVPQDKKLGRNDPCWCGSGKKYKHCHMKEDMAQRARV